MPWAQTLAAILTAFFEALRPYAGAIGAFFAGRASQQGSDAKKALKDVRAAGEAADAMRAEPGADQLRYLERRGRVRGVPGQRGDGQSS